MAFATINLFGVTDPDAGYLQESSEEKSVEVATCKDATGVTKLAVPKEGHHNDSHPQRRGGLRAIGFPKYFDRIERSHYRGQGF